MQEATHILQKYWKHESFRELQEEIITGAIEGSDIIALLPTGGGKSLCFQIPALIQEGIAIVISPLVALMEDQVQALKEKGIKALALTGGLSFNQVDVLLDNCIYGNYKFLYLSPERLQQDLVQQRIKQMPVNFFAVDEAHCISQWGHDFRPAYLEISLLRDLHPNVPVMALTASATKRVVKDIEELLKLKQPIVYKKSLERRNISFNVLFTEDKLYRVRQLLQDQKETAIIYVRSRKATMEIAKELQQYGYTATDYHGGLSSKEKTARLEKWLSEEVKVMVATSAFGMGIDKPNVRNVIHLNLPESIESYFQEAGRAGRDGNISRATIITNNSDLPLLKNQFIKALPDLEFTTHVYRKLTSYFRIAYGEGHGITYNFNFNDFCSQYQLNSIRAYNTLQLLDRISIIKLSPQFQKTASLRFIVSTHQLFHYLQENDRFDPVVKAILRTYGGVIDNRLPINLVTVSNKADVTEQETLKVLNYLHRDKIIDFEFQENDSSITFLVPREDKSSIYPYANYIKEQGKNKIDKINSLLEYVDNTTVCRSKQLLQYFGEEGVNPCGICQVCRKKSKTSGKEELKKISMEIILQLETGEKSSREIVTAIQHPEEGILNAIQLLLEKDIVTLTPGRKYKIKHL